MATEDRGPSMHAQVEMTLALHGATPNWGDLCNVAFQYIWQLNLLVNSICKIKPTVVKIL
jgi:hypothetical protein